MNLDYRIAFINDQPRLLALSEGLGSVSAFALDIETINWWSPQSERVALIQLAYRAGNQLRVAVIDALAPLDLTALRRPLELDTATKVIHNAAFDAVRLARHFNMRPAPIHDTMLAARRGGERRYSLKAQVEKHLNLSLDKKERESDWSLRPLHPKQLSYAALDAVAALLLYEHQVSRGLRGDYRLRAVVADEQVALPLSNPLRRAGQAVERMPAERLPAAKDDLSNATDDLSDASLALLGIITELPSRYGPDQLAASVGDDRVGLAGWIIDRVLGRGADLDESSAKIEIEGLCRRGLVRITPTRRLEANESGRGVWEKRKPV
jgi:DNA polymerase I-like protein with 3'-5' exonuclease and polymerase domains